MLAVLFRILLTFNATSVLLIVYQVKSPIVFEELTEPIRYLASVALIGVPVCLTYVSIKVSKFLPRDSISPGHTEAISHADNAFLPSYLGYFFVALSVPDLLTLVFVYALVFVFTFNSQALYYNPLYLVFGFKFYDTRSSSGVTSFLITRRTFRKPTEVLIPNAARINGFTLLEEG